MPVLLGSIEKNTVITDADIQAFEATIGQSLPLDYRDFLLKTNGGYLNRRLSINDGRGIPLLIMFFRGLVEKPLDHQLTLDPLPAFDQGRYLSFASLRGRDPLLLGLSGDNRGKILYLNSVIASKTERLEKDLDLIADSFTHFTTLLYETLEHQIERVMENDLAEELALLLGKIPEDYINRMGRNLIQEAAASGRLAILSLLVDHGYDISQAIEFGYMSLPPQVMEDLLKKQAEKATGLTSAIEREMYKVENARDSDYQAFRSAGISVKLPAGFFADNGDSFVNPNSQARLDLLTYDESLETVSQIYSEAHWLVNKYVMSEKMPVEINNRRGLYFSVEPTQSTFAMQFLLLENEGKSIQLSTAYPKEDTTLKQHLLDALLSVVTFEFDPYSLLPFTLDMAGQTLRVAKIQPNVLFVSLDGLWPTQHADQVFFVGLADYEEVPEQMRKAYMTAFFMQSGQRDSHAQLPVITSTIEVTVDGLTTLITMGYNADSHLFAATIFGYGRVYRFWGSTLAGKMTLYRQQFDHLVQSFKRKEEIKIAEKNYQQALAALLPSLTSLIKPRTILSFVPDEQVETQASSLFGKAVLPTGISVPVTSQSNEPMGLILQLLDTDIPNLPVSRLQIFATPSRFRDADNLSQDINILVGFSEQQTDWRTIEDGWTEATLMLHQPKRCKIVAQEAQSLPDWDNIVAQYPDILALCEKGAPQSPVSLYQTALAMLGIILGLHILGGDCPSDIKVPTGSDGQPMVFAARIATEAEYGLVWKHGGYIALFYEANDPSKWCYIICSA